MGDERARLIYGQMNRMPHPYAHSATEMRGGGVLRVATGDCNCPSLRGNLPIDNGERAFMSAWPRS